MKRRHKLRAVIEQSLKKLNEKEADFKVSDI